MVGRSVSDILESPGVVIEEVAGLNAADPRLYSVWVTKWGVDRSILNGPGKTIESIDPFVGQ